MQRRPRTNRRRLRGRTCAVAVAVLLVAAALPASADSTPNILWITVDNLGYGDLASYNPRSEILTPRLDQLAASGGRLTNFYTPSPTCTVSRACLLTGRVPQRHGLVDQLAGVAGNYGVGLNPAELTIAQLLKRAPTPYVTGCFGKWNIGFAKGSRPTERGFDEFIGHASGNMDYYRHNYRERHDLYQGVELLRRPGEYATDIFAEAASDFIQRHSEKGSPWFCYVPFNAPHFPVKGNKRSGEANRWQAPEWAFEPYAWTPDEEDPRKRYAAVIFALDAGVGRVLDAVQKAGVADNTFVFLMSDNGAFRLGRGGIDVGDNWPLRSGGVTCWEGGLRVPALVRWPKVQPGSIIDTPLWSPDLFIAALALAKVERPAGLILDGRDPLPAFAGEGDSLAATNFYFQYRRHAALRFGRWKIVREKPTDAWRLFDLDEDIAESRDLAAAHPGRVRELESKFNAWNAAIEAGRRDRP